MAKAYVKFELGEDLKEKILKVVEKAALKGKVKRGVNETTKSVERGLAKFVVIAEDVDPEEIVMHLPILCEEKGVPYGYVKFKSELGKASGIDTAASSVAILDAGEAKDELKEIISEIEKVKKAS